MACGHCERCTGECDDDDVGGWSLRTHDDDVGGVNRHAAGAGKGTREGALAGRGKAGGRRANWP